MIPALILAGVAVALRSLLAGWFDRVLLGAPVVMVLAGVAAAFALPGDALALTLNTQVAQRVAELLLAVLLFVGATAVRGGRLWGPAPGPVLRLLFLAMPLSLAAAVGTGLVLLPELGWAALLVLACVVVPIDFAPAEGVVRDRALPHRVRTALNVESGYNDGIVSPIFLFALILASDRTRQDSPTEALTTAVPFALIGVGVGLVTGLLLGWLLDRASRLHATTEASRRVFVLCTPVVTYAVAVALGGTGFVASFVAGVAFCYLHGVLAARRARRAREQPDAAPTTAYRLAGADYHLLTEVTSLATMLMWFVVGLAAVATLSEGVTWQAVVYTLLALTVLRLGPVLLAFTGSRFDRRERLLVGLLGPRGTTSIVFGLLAFNTLPTGPVADLALTVTVLVVLVSALVHGTGAPLLARALAVRTRRLRRGAPDG
ncbi:cation:proton antiporter domain-containing protein [Actinomycetospora soli]|uniref:cation:proton antiporter domain-containing protein n=1 Tax=Actinomycetospora soli TaxID=2893887 RepID=UPI001E309129|nr:cation:proton antiporter [Actinomycetospora soli]MCD2187775.1 cation:proton antiporter [Actinomycetospora soli]